MESLTRRRTQVGIFVLLFIFISLNQLSVTIYSAPYDNELINSHLRKLLARPPRTRPPPPKANPSKQFEVPPPGPPPPDNGQ
ncbi:hypothetical protein C5167_012572 [Papaver somniferum]|uniref:Uncharacterized protein n=1 Tax=Papaver somniferum TaxID=3469 RepID=A0A4Y7J243_PAPSO|nr:hypothetical protein C5167_012572 [Papaver somniferum]